MEIGEEPFPVNAYQLFQQPTDGPLPKGPIGERCHKPSQAPHPFNIGQKTIPQTDRLLIRS